MSSPTPHTPDTPGRTRGILDLAIRLATLQLGSGAGAQDATLTMSGVARAYGLTGVDPDVTNTELTLSWTNPSTDESLSRRHFIRRRDLDYHRLSQAAALYARIDGRRIDLPDARRELLHILRGRPLVPVMVRRLGWGVVGAGAAVLLGGGALVAAVAFLAAVLLDVVTGSLGRRGVPLLFQTFVGGAIGPIAAVLVHLVTPAASATLVVVATIVVLLAGVTTFGGVQDVLTGFYVTGMARLAEAVVATVGLAGGVIATSLVLNRVSAPIAIRVSEAQLVGDPLVAGIAAVVMAAGFALAAQLPWRALWAACALGVIATLLYLVCTKGLVDPVWSSGLAAIGVGLIASPLARVTRTPVLPLIVTAVVPLLPGLLLFNGMMQVASSQVDGLFDVFRAAGVAGALAAGSIFGHYIVRFVTGHARTVRLGKL